MKITDEQIKQYQTQPPAPRLLDREAIEQRLYALLSTYVSFDTDDPHDRYGLACLIAGHLINTCTVYLQPYQVFLEQLKAAPTQDTIQRVQTPIDLLPIAELRNDLAECHADVAVCEQALRAGVRVYSGGLVSDRLASNREMIEIIEAALARRQEAGNGG